MKKIAEKRAPAFLFLLLLIPTITMAQYGRYSSTDKKAIKYYEEGEMAHNQSNSELAIANFKLAIERDSNFVEAHRMLGFVYMLTGENVKTKKHFEKVIALVPEKLPNMYFYLGTLEMQEGNYSGAKKRYRQYLSFPQPVPEFAKTAKKDLRDCKFAEIALQNPVPFEPVNLGAAVNSELHEYFPCLTADDYMLLYTRQLNEGSNFSKFNEDFHVSFNQNDGWSKNVNIGMPINTATNEGAPTLSVDGHILVFTACDQHGYYGQNRKGYGSCDLFVSQRIGNNWTTPVNLGPPINTSRWETQPSLASDGMTLYFVRGTPSRSGMKGQDIFVTQIDDDGRWSEPKPLNKNINTDGREESVFIHPDNQTIYFSSDGHPGMGGLDIFMSKKDENGEWGPAVNLGYPINTHHNENSLMVDAKGELAYFASNRAGGLGGLDLYSFKVPKSLKPALVTYLKGKVFDAKTKEPLYSKFELIDLATGKVVIESWSNKGNGEFLVPLPTNRNYALNASKSGYLFFSENFSLKENAVSKKPYHKDVPMHPIQVGEKVILKNIFFETAKYDLKMESRGELNKLASFLKDNPGIKIELSGHTDNVGSVTDNNTLSHNRAKAVYDYLNSQSVDPTRLSYKGYGEAQPIATNETSEGRAQNRRTEFKIIGTD